MEISNRKFRRGAIIAPPFRQEGDTFRFGQNVEYEDILRFSSFYFDRACEPQTMLFGAPPTKDISYLLEKGFLSRSNLPYNSVDSGLLPDGRELRFATVLDTLRAMPGSQNGRWSILDWDKSYFSFQNSSLDTIFIDLIERFPAPDKDVPLEEILRFNKKHGVHLLNFRNDIFDLASNLVASKGAAPIRDLISDKIGRSLDQISEISIKSGLFKYAHKLSIGLNLPSSIISTVLSLAGLPSTAAIAIGNSVQIGFAHSPFKTRKLAIDAYYILQSKLDGIT